MVVIVSLAVGPGFMDDDDPGKFTSTMFAAGLPAFLLYFAKDSIQGISLGKWILGIMVRNSNNPNNIPSFGKLLIRNLFLIIWPVEFIVLALSKEKKRLGDRTANTIVLSNPDRPGKLPRIITLVVVGATFFVFAYLFAATAMKNSEAYKTAIKEIERNQEIVTDTGGIKGYGMMPAGNISISNGVGQAQLQIKILGNEKDLDVRVYLTKEPGGEWELKEMGM